MPGKVVEPQMELALCLVKPDGVRRGLIGKIITAFENKSLELRALAYLRATPEQVRENYAANAREPWFEEMVTYMTSGYIVPMAWQGNHAVDSVRQVIGEKDPWESGAGSIRGDYANDGLRTVVHGSRTMAESLHEIGIWFPTLLGPDEPPQEKAAPGAVEFVSIMRSYPRAPLGDFVTLKSYAPLSER